MPANTYATTKNVNAKKAKPASYFSPIATNANTDPTERITSSLKTPRDKETGHLRKQPSRLVATNHNINDVEWLQSLNEDITWIKGDPIQEISQQLNQNRQAGKTTSELHIVAHGSNGEIKLGNTILTKQYLEKSSLFLQEWRLEAIHLWSCCLGDNTSLLSTLESLTGAEVFASKSIIDRDNTRIKSNKGNSTYLEQITSPKEIEAWNGNLMSPANSYVTVHTGHIDSGATDYFRYYGDGDNRNGAGVAILQSMPWWGDADLAEQWALNSNYASPNLNIDGGTGGDEEQVAFAYNFYLWGEARNTRYATKRKPDDYHNYGGAGGDEVGQHWSGGYAVDFSSFSGITINQTGPRNGTDLLTTEAGGSSTFTVVLDTAPTANVTVTITGLKTQEGSLDTDTLTFTTANWDTPQTITVTGVDDSYASGDYTYSLIATASNTGGYAGTERAATNVKNVDDDTNGVTIAQTGTTDGSGNLRTTEAGSTSTFTVVLDAEPTDTVTVSITGLDATENSLSTDTLTFTTTDWDTAQTVTITGVDDSIVDGDITTTLTATASNTGGYAGTESDTTTVKNTDNETSGVTIAQTGTTDGSGNLRTTEAGSTSTFTVVLDAEPTDTVTVSITGLDATENSLSTDTLTFTTTDWDTAQTVTITGVDDSIVDGDITTTLTATASNTGGYAGTESDTTTVKNTDNETSGVTIAQTGTTDGSGNLRTTEAGSTSTFTVVLDAEPTDTVTVSITGLDATENSLSTDTLTFTTTDWDTAQTVTITGVDDSIVDGDITTTLTATASNTGGYAGTESDTTTVKNTDNETSGVTIAQTGTTDGSGNLRTTEAGSTSTFTVVLDAEPTDTVTVSITGLDATENSLSTDTLTFTTTDWDTAQTVTITGVDDSIVDGDITTTLTATASNTGGYAGTESDTTTVKNTDNETSGVTIAQTGTTDGSGNLRTTEAGSTSTFTVVLDAEPTDTVTVSITGLDATENSLSTDTLTFTTTDWDTAQTVTITGVDDSIVDGDITTTLTATASNTGGYAGTESDTTTVKNTDNETSGVTIAQTGTTDGSGNLRTTEAGSTSTFTVVLDAEPTDTVTVSITGLDATENSLSTDTLTFTTTDWDTAQTVTITGVDDSIVDGDITTTLTATASNTGGYAGTESDTTTVKNTDNETSGVTIAQTGTTDGSGNLRTTEAGSTSTFTVVLDAEPTDTVTVSITGLDATENSLSTDTLTFTTTDWDTAQTVTITGVDDSIVDGDITTTLTATANSAGGYSGESTTTTVKNTDDDTAYTTPPLISGPSGDPGDPTSSTSIAENIPTVHTFTTDEPVSWTLVGSDDDNKLTIDPNDGVLVFKSPPDFENPNDIGDTPGNNTYIVTVRATDDDGNIDDQTVTITITDVDESDNEDGDGISRTTEEALATLVASQTSKGNIGDMNDDGKQDSEQNALATLAWRSVSDFESGNAGTLTDSEAIIYISALSSSNKADDNNLQLNNIRVLNFFDTNEFGRNAGNSISTNKSTGIQTIDLASGETLTTSWDPLAFELKPRNGIDNLTDLDPQRKGTQSRIYINTSASNLDQDKVNRFIKFVSNASIKFAQNSGRPLEDLDGNTIKNEGWYDFTQRLDSNDELIGDGANLIFNRKGRLQGIDLTLTDNSFGDNDPTAMQLFDPGTLAFKAKESDLGVRRPEIRIQENASKLKGKNKTLIHFRTSQPTNNFTLSDIKVKGGLLWNFKQRSNKTYTAIFKPNKSTKRPAKIHVPSKSFTSLDGKLNRKSNNFNHIDFIEEEVNNQHIYLVVDASNSLSLSSEKTSDPLRTTKITSVQTILNAIIDQGYNLFQKGGKEPLTKKLINKQVRDQASSLQEFWKTIKILSPQNSKKTGINNLTVELICYDYIVRHKSFELGTDTYQEVKEFIQYISHLKTPFQRYGQSIDRNKEWQQAGLQEPSWKDLFNGHNDNNKPSNLYAGTEMLGALEGLAFSLKKQSKQTIKSQSTKVLIITDGRPERREWWDTYRPDQITNNDKQYVSNKNQGMPIQLPKSLGGKSITTSGLLYNEEADAHYMTNNAGKLQWPAMNKRLTRSLNAIANNSPKDAVVVKAIGINSTQDSSLQSIQEDLLKNRLLDPKEAIWTYETEMII